MERAAKRRIMLLSVSLCAIAFGSQFTISPALAQQMAADEAQAAAPAPSNSRAPAADPTVDRTPATSPNAVVNLVNMLVQQGTISQEQADKLTKQAEDDAYVSRQAARDATAKADQASKTADAASAAASPPGSKRVVYVPEIVKKELRDELRKEVMTEAKDEGWASPGSYPEWASRITVFGDLRTRYEAQFFPGGGYNAPGTAINFNAINTGSPYDISTLNNTLRPTFDSDQDRDRFRLRARVGINANLFDGFTAGFRIATGDSNSPVSTNQTVGSSGGDFSKYSVWLDRAFVKYSPFNDFVVLNVGRFDNPFFSPTDLVWYSELGFDGAAAQVKYEVVPGFSPFAVAGAFPVFNTSLNFPDDEVDKFASNDKYLFGGQVGFNWKAVPDMEWTFAVAYFDFTDIQGQLSTPCDVTIVTACSTDNLRPSFAQKGNTYMALRNIVPPVSYTGGDFSQPQYFGLASDFKPVVVSSRLDFSQFNPVHIILDSEFVWNSAFNRGAIGAVAVNNLAGTTDGSLGPYAGGDLGWMARLTVGDKTMQKFGDWNVHIGYKYLESDATVDAFTDSDFGLGGTNLKGYIVGGNFAWSQNVSSSIRWLSASEIAGAPYAVDVLQVDLNARF
jgi:hypothetical protein